MTRKKQNRNWQRPQCDNCGRFIALKDFEDGTARNDLISLPDEPVIGRFVTLCKHCNAPTREEAP